MKIRQNLYIDRDVSEALEALATSQRVNKSRFVNDALKTSFARRGTEEVDDIFKARLDRMSRDILHARRDTEILLESLSLFIRYQLAVTPPLSDSDAAAIAVGRDRFERFVAQIGRQMASGVRTFASEARS